MENQPNSDSTENVETDTNPSDQILNTEPLQPTSNPGVRAAVIDPPPTGGNSGGILPSQSNSAATQKP